MNDIDVKTEELEMFRKQAVINEMYAKVDRHKTNHILHLILSIISLGMWIWIWCAVSADNCIKRNRILKKYNKKLESNTGLTLFVFFLVINVIVFWGKV